MPQVDIRILLKHVKWDRDVLLIRLTDQNRDELFAEANVSYSRANVVAPAISKPPRLYVKCVICSCELLPKVFSSNTLTTFL